MNPTEFDTRISVIWKTIWGRRQLSSDTLQFDFQCGAPVFRIHHLSAFSSLRKHIPCTFRYNRKVALVLQLHLF